MPGTASGASIEAIEARAYTIPTDLPEADGTMRWDSTTLVVVEVRAGEQKGLGYTYTHASIVPLIGSKLAGVVEGWDAMDVQGASLALERSVRNLGREGLAATAISAIDTALWDLKAKLVELPLCQLLGRQRNEVPIYGSGGFTTYDDVQLQAQLQGWVENEGCAWVKMKIGTEPGDDPRRVRVAREAIGDHGLFVDANGAYTRKQALRFAEVFVGEAGVAWFEEPVSSDDLEGLALLRQRAPAMMEIAAGEYGYTTDYFRRMLGAGAVDVMQVDATRCGGFTGFLAAAALAEIHHTDVSAHCAPALHLHAACAAPRFRHQEWFHDHVRIEHMLFDGAPSPTAGAMRPDLSRPGLGLELKAADAERWRAA